MWMASGVAKDPAGLFTWGNNGAGVNGNSLTAGNQSSPVQVGTSTFTHIVGGGYKVLAVRNDGTLWAWGDGVAGQLGLGNTTSYSSPKQVGSDTNWTTQLCARGDTSQHIKADGTMWIWGSGYQGNLGLGSTTSFSSPVQIGGLTNWAKVSINGCANDTTFHGAIKTDGTLWMWGRNGSGQLGNGFSHPYNQNRSSPIQIGSATDWTQISLGGYTALALRGGTLWSWGDNPNGQLGLGDTANRSSPTQIGSGSNWSDISCGDSICMALKTDGTLWTWGRNNDGSLMLGDTTSRSSPTQVGSGTDWKKICAGTNMAMAIRGVNNELWVAGQNNQRQLVTGDTLARSSPVQIGNGGWTRIQITSQQSMAGIRV
jgi:alpha-tubulin suppressor-like RCC1 family protein